MSLIKELISSLAKEGEITHEFEVKGRKFVLESMTLEEQSLAESMVDIKYLEQKYDAKDLFVMRDTVERHRNVAKLAMTIKSIDGESPVKEEATNHELFLARKELKDELLQLPPTMIDQMLQGYNNLYKKEIEFYKDPHEVAEK